MRWARPPGRSKAPQQFSKYLSWDLFTEVPCSCKAAILQRPCSPSSNDGHEDPNERAKANHGEDQGGEWHQHCRPRQWGSGFICSYVTVTFMPFMPAFSACEAICRRMGRDRHDHWVSLATCGCRRTWPRHPLPAWSRPAGRQMLPGRRARMACVFTPPWHLTACWGIPMTSHSSHVESQVCHLSSHELWLASCHLSVPWAVPTTAGLKSMPDFAWSWCPSLNLDKAHSGVHGYGSNWFNIQHERVAFGATGPSKRLKAISL